MAKMIKHLAPDDPDKVDDGEADDDEADDALADRAPGLALLGRFARGLGQVAWFAHVGARFDAGLRQDAADYLSALGFPDATLTRLANWAEAADAAETHDWNSPAFEAEEQLRAALALEADRRFGTEAIEIALNHIATRAAEAAEAGALRAANLWDVEDVDLVNAAIGAGVQAAHLAALVLAADAGEEHAFALRFRLFQHGRWPVGIVGSSFNVF